MAALAKVAIDTICQEFTDGSYGSDYRKRLAREGNPPSTEIEGESFQWLGEGSDRMAVLGPDGVVYKAAKYDYGTAQDTKERALYDVLSEFGIPWCPDYFPYGDVLAMRRYKVTTDDPHRQPWEKDMSRVASDLHAGNIGYDDDGNPYLIDAGYGWYSQDEIRTEVERISKGEPKPEPRPPTPPKAEPPRLRVMADCDCATCRKARRLEREARQKARCARVGCGCQRCREAHAEVWGPKSRDGIPSNVIRAAMNYARKNRVRFGEPIRIMMPERMEWNLVGPGDLDPKPIDVKSWTVNLTRAEYEEAIGMAEPRINVALRKLAEVPGVT